MKFRIATILTILLAFSLSFAALAQQPSGKGRPDGATPGQRPDGTGRPDGVKRPDGQRPDGAQPGQRPGGGGRRGGGKPRG